ncbi:MAG: DinB family protein [Planctomycetes bacterium]|nr:DinB family protein [Planctomycetota bacterium]
MTSPSLFDPGQRAKLLDRIAALRPDSQRRWGRMDVAQMLAHCQAPLRVALGDLKLKRGVMGILFGKMAKKKLLDPKPWKPGMPTAPEFIVKDRREFARERDTLVELVRRFGDGGPAALTADPHPFFGPLTAQEWDALQGRHLDHHLHQFGA